MLNSKIAKMYQEVYACPTCPNHVYYEGYNLDAFRPGSVVAYTMLLYTASTNTTKEDFQKLLVTLLIEASDSQRQGLVLTEVRVSTTALPIPGPPETVPGWGIALLVLVCVLLLLALIAFLLLIIYRCRRNHRGNIDLLSDRNSYHPMSEYPTYHTHGRYIAPNNKPNPYSETLPNNGTNPYSYTNPVMANENL
ncbi:mucin-1 [Rhineura floridana]|uniref:mucin-1 n=1 Tax=Rhineura floridana TaxID=261503 RepID=UPI002AC84042|nr:mucin-1 [Rhineura floridana]